MGTINRANSFGEVQKTDSRLGAATLRPGSLRPERGGIVEQTDNQSGIFDGELSGAIQQASRMLLTHEPITPGSPEKCASTWLRWAKTLWTSSSRVPCAMMRVIDDGDAINSRSAPPCNGGVNNRGSLDA